LVLFAIAVRSCTGAVLVPAKEEVKGMEKVEA
jgi:hypothetical protein